MDGPFVFQVNLGGMIDILSNHLYSSPEVFLRELLQNAVDAVSERRKHEPKYRDGTIAIRLVPGEQLSFTDTGSGLTDAEIHRFLAVIGQSSKRDLETGRIYEDYIGRFGIGLLSCFMVTDEICIHTRSVKEPDKAWVFRGKPDGTYTIDPLPLEEKPEVGTSVIIRAKKGAEEYFQEDRICDLIRYYGLPIPLPITMQTDGDPYRINERFAAGGTEAESILALGKEIFDTDFMGYIPLESEKGLFSGVAYILPHAVSLHAKAQHRIYLKNMLLTEDGDAILPKWSGFMRCFLNTTKLRPTASRESFYEDELLAEAREELSRCISTYLLGLAERDRALLERIIRVHYMAIKSMAAEDDEFFRTFIQFMRFETNMGELTGRELMARTGAVFYTGDINQFHRTAAIMLAQGQLLVNTCYVYDTPLLEKIQETYGVLELAPLQTEALSDYLTEPQTDAHTEAAALLRTARDMLAQFDCDAQLKIFSPNTMPVFYMLDEDAETLREIRRSQEHSNELFASMLSSFAEEFKDHRATLFLNWSAPLIRRLAALEDAEKVRVCLQILYVQALLTGRFPLQGGEMALLNEDLIRLIEWGVS